MIGVSKTFGGSSILSSPVAAQPETPERSGVSGVSGVSVSVAHDKYL